MDNSNKIILKVEKSKVQEKRFNAYKMEHSGMLSPNDVSFWQGYKVAIDELFGDEPVEDNYFGKNIVSTDDNTLTVNQEDNKIKEINFCKILKEHENENFWSPLMGRVRVTVDNLVHIHYGSATIDIDPNGCDELGNLAIYPSRTQRDWNVWIEEQKRKIPKTWSDLERLDEITEYGAEIVRTFNNRWWDSTKGKTPIEKSALALLKIHQLIEVGYGGTIDYKTWLTGDCWGIVPNSQPTDDNMFLINGMPSSNIGVLFHRYEQAKEFLSYPENIQLLKDYFMI